MSKKNVIAVVSEYVIEMKFKSVHLFSQYGAQLRNARYDQSNNELRGVKLNFMSALLEYFCF